MKKYLVGGAVRDKVMGLIPKDWDYVFIDVTEDELLKLGYLRISRSFPVFSHNDHPQDQFSLARTEKKTGPGYTGFVVETENIKLEEDLRRRDFTINSMAMDDSGNVIDPFGGKSDIVKKVLRHTGPHFVEDPLRIIRTARFAARFYFTIAEETKTLISEMLAMGALTEIPSVRIALEFDKAILASQVFDFHPITVNAAVSDFKSSINVCINFFSRSLSILCSN